MKFEVIVQLKQNVFNAEEKEVFSSISSEHKINSIKISKLFTIDIDNSIQNPEEVVKKIAEKTLANTVIETFTVKKIND